MRWYLPLDPMARGTDYEVIFSVDGGDTMAERINVRRDKYESANIKHFRKRIEGTGWLGFPTAEDVKIVKYRNR